VGEESVLRGYGVPGKAGETADRVCKGAERSRAGGVRRAGQADAGGQAEMEANVAGAGPELRQTPAPPLRETINRFIMNMCERRDLASMSSSELVVYFLVLYKLPGVVMYGPGIRFSDNQSMELEFPISWNRLLDFKVSLNIHLTQLTILHHGV